jgi:hypothetical protein
VGRKSKPDVSVRDITFLYYYYKQVIMSDRKDRGILSNYEIIDVCKALKIPLEGVYSKDELVKMNPKEGKCYIINIQNRNDGNGTHWVCCYDTPYGVGYYDSFGLDPPVMIKSFMKRSKEVIYTNTRQKQDINNESCGWFCIAFCDYLHKNMKKTKSLHKLMDDFMELFEDKYSRNNSKLLEKYISMRL